jgi:hypothetical protein
MRNHQARDYARIALGLIRLFNGAAALFAPSMLMQRLGVDPKAQAATAYGLRMFGIRTILIGADLLRDRPEARAEALRAAPLIHASDVVSAVTAGLRGDLPRRGALLATLISSVNVALAVVAQPGRA